MEVLRGELRRRLRHTRIWRPYRRWRDRRHLAGTVGLAHQVATHRSLVARRQERERSAQSEEDHGAGSAAADLEEFFAGFHVVDPGIPLIRVGPRGDGGYLLPDDFGGVAACFSPGVAGEIGFDTEIADRGIPVHMIDRSVPGLPLVHESIDFEPLFLGARTEPGWTDLLDWVERRAPGTDDLILEMDIEGAEWAVLLTTPAETLRRFRILVLELHDLHTLARRSSLQVIRAALTRVLDDFELVHLHPNNHEYPVPYLGFELHPVVEATFLRKDRVRQAQPRQSLEHPLDSPNSDIVVDYPLDPRWL